MYCNAIAQSYHPKNPIIKLWDTAPEPYAIVRLSLSPYRMLNNPDTPFLSKVRTLAQNFILKIGSEVIARHLSETRNGNMLRIWCTRQGSNLRPSDPKSDALSN